MNRLIANEDLMRDDLQQSLERHHINPATLSTFQRILLTTDGTLTDILEAYLFEQIQVVKISQNLIPIPKSLPIMELAEGTEVIDRRILLQGRISRKNFIYAESILVPERLDDNFRHELFKTKTPIGKIWLEQKVETFKEILDSATEPAQGLAEYFNIEASDKLLSRTYRVFTNGKPVMMITEKFPESYFLNSV
ncbi:chorismate--pyruvate lyase family protein [Coleofasciculus sp.]|uniref:chorismate--pyruvate lyase family protein n=1 Tax=Coleofasciculus sp. TaxID=3100458 RepID=UPI003A1A134F